MSAHFRSANPIPHRSTQFSFRCSETLHAPRQRQKQRPLARPAARRQRRRQARAAPAPPAAPRRNSPSATAPIRRSRPMPTATAAARAAMARSVIRRQIFRWQALCRQARWTAAAPRRRPRAAPRLWRRAASALQPRRPPARAAAAIVRIADRARISAIARSARIRRAPVAATSVPTPRAAMRRVATVRISTAMIARRVAIAAMRVRPGVSPTRSSATRSPMRRAMAAARSARTRRVAKVSAVAMATVRVRAPIGRRAIVRTARVPQAIGRQRARRAMATVRDGDRPRGDRPFSADEEVRRRQEVLARRAGSWRPAQELWRSPIAAIAERSDFERGPDRGEQKPWQKREGGSDDRGSRDSRPPRDGARNFDRPKFDKPRFDRPRDDRPERGGDSERPRFSRPREDRPSFDRPREPRGRMRLAGAWPQRAPRR